MGKASKRRILAVDDDPLIRRLYAELLDDQYQLCLSPDGDAALHVFPSFRPHLVLLDIMLPGTNGYDVCRRMRLNERYDSLHIIMVSGKSSRAEQLKAYEGGADDYIVKPVDPNELTSRVNLHFRLRDALDEARSIRQEIASNHSELKRLAAHRLQEVVATQDVAVFMLAKVAESRDYETGEHLNRMRIYSQILAEELRKGSPYAGCITDRFLEDLYRSSPLHDIGKVGIGDNILLKPGRLTASEFETMKTHTVIGASILDEAVTRSPCGGFLAMAAIIARYHHERFDGTGYPENLVGQEIPLPARIVALADVYDALTSARPYKDPYPPAVARRMIEEESDRHFDPVIVDAFLRRFDEFVAVQHEYGVVASLTMEEMSYSRYQEEGLRLEV